MTARRPASRSNPPRPSEQPSSLLSATRRTLPGPEAEAARGSRARPRSARFHEQTRPSPQRPTTPKRRRQRTTANLGRERGVGARAGLSTSDQPGHANKNGSGPKTDQSPTEKPIACIRESAPIPRPPHTNRKPPTGATVPAKALISPFGSRERPGMRRVISRNPGGRHAPGLPPRRCPDLTPVRQAQPTARTALRQRPTAAR
jgi:hypothetical protein